MFIEEHLHQVADGERVDIVRRAPRGDRFAVALHCAKDVTALPAGRSFYEEATEDPDHPQKAAENEMRHIDKENFTEALRGLDAPGFQFLAKKVELELRVALAGNRGAFAITHAELFHQTPRLLFGDDDGCERGDAGRGVLGRRGWSHRKGAAQTRPEGLQGADRLISTICERGVEPAFRVFLKITCDGVGILAHRPSDDPMIDSFVMHAQDQQT